MSVLLKAIYRFGASPNKIPRKLGEKREGQRDIAYTEEKAV